MRMLTMAHVPRVNAGVDAPIARAAGVNIQANTDVYVHDAVAGDTDYPADPDVSAAELVGINAHNMVFCKFNRRNTVNVKFNQSTISDQKLEVFQNFDNVSRNKMMGIEFVGVSVDKVNGDDARARALSSHAATAVQVSGTITLQNNDMQQIAPMTPVCWEACKTKSRLKGVPKLSLPVIRKMQDNRRTRILDRVMDATHANNGEFAVRARTADNAYVFDNTKTYVKNMFGRAVDATSTTALTTKHGGPFSFANTAGGKTIRGKYAEHTTTYKILNNKNPVMDAALHMSFMKATINYVLSLVDDDERRRVGLCLETRDGQAHVLLKH